MKKITFKLLLAIALMFSAFADAQCLSSTFGLYPAGTSVASSCDGITATSITTLGYASEYSNVEVIAGETYTFRSSLSTDYITISSDDGASAAVFGTTPVTWVADVSGVVRFYTHTDDLCGESQDLRTRSFVCGIPPCTQPVVSFAKTFDCLSASFEVTVDITDLGSAFSITVTDDQGSASQSASSANMLTFGPYAFGTSVVLTATNDQTPICNVVSDAQVVLACPPANDECDGAVALTVNPDASCTDFVSSTITAATASAVDAAACGGTEDDDVWFSFVATNAAQIISLNNVAGSTTDLFHSLWTGTCDALTVVPNSCSDANSSLPSGLTVGETYYLRVYTWTGTPAQTSTFDVCIGTPPPPPANDECDGAIALTVNPDSSCTEFVSATVASATASSVDAAACGGTEDDDVWFSFVANGTIQSISLNNVAGSTTDLFHSLWTGADCSSLALVPNSCSDANASVATGLTPGDTYYLRVYTWTGTFGQTSTFDVCIGTPPPPPANDDCANAIVLNCGDILTAQSTESATGGTPTSCVGTIGNDIWYSFEGDDQVITLTANASVDAPQVEVYASSDGTCSGFAAGTCIASAGTGETVVTTSFVSQTGTTYYIHIGSWINGNPATVFDLSITCEAPATPPANDECDGAESLTVNPDSSCAVVTSGTISGATASAVDTTACVGSEDDDVWYSFVANDVLQAINLNNIVGSSIDLNHSVWSGTCAGLTLVPGSCGTTASIATGLTAGETYYVRVFTGTTAALQNTTFDICIGTPPPPPANDDCTGAIEITAGGEFTSSPVIGSNVSSTSTAGLPAFICQTNRANDVWYSVVVPASGSLTIETDASPGTLMTDSVISVYTGTCGALVEVGCNDDDGNGNFSKTLLTGLTPGETLYIGVWKWGTSSDGEFQLSAYDASLLSNDTFDAASFRSYPNPVKDILHFSYDKTITSVAVYNLLGQEVITKSTNANQSQVDMSNLAKGTYLVKIMADNQMKTIKVIKE